jgi:hypothetical protein
MLARLFEVRRKEALNGKDIIGAITSVIVICSNP